MAGAEGLQEEELKKAKEAINILSSLVCSSSGEAPRTSSRSTATKKKERDSDTDSDNDFSSRSKGIIKAADKAFKALKGMKSGLEGSSSSRKKRIKAEVSSLFNTSKKPRKCAWKHRFVCLAWVGESKVTTSAVAKDDLLKAGLGEKVIEFSNLQASAEDFRDLIYNTFPKMKQGGGFELCRCLPNSRQLEPLSSAAYSSPALFKERVGNARTYIRPLQRDLSLEEVLDLPQGAKEECLECGLMFPITSLKEHLSTCRKDQRWPPSPLSSVSSLDTEFLPAIPDCTKEKEAMGSSQEVVMIESDIEEEFVREAIHQSMQFSLRTDPAVVSSMDSTSNLAHGVNMLRKQMLYREETSFLHLDVRRKCLLRDAMKEAKKKTFDPKKHLQVTFVGEGAIDYGGPRREFFRLLAHEASEYFFEGRSGYKFFVNNVSALQSREFFFLGQFVGMSVAQGGNGLSFLARQVYSYIITGDYSRFHVVVSDIPEGVLKFAVEKILNSEDDVELKATLGIDEIVDLIIQTGFSKPLRNLTIANKDELISSLTLYHLMIKVKSSMDQFIDGLKDVGLLNLMQNSPVNWEPLFFNTNTALSADALKGLFTVLYADEGSTVKAKEVDAYVYFADFLDECFDDDVDCSVEDVLVFFSGSSCIPPLGFDYEPTLSFNHHGTLATASTCDLQLRLPVLHDSYDKFKEAMLLSIKGHDGFGST